MAHIKWYIVPSAILTDTELADMEDQMDVFFLHLSINFNLNLLEYRVSQKLSAISILLYFISPFPSDIYKMCHYKSVSLL